MSHISKNLNPASSTGFAEHVQRLQRHQQQQQLQQQQSWRPQELERARATSLVLRPCQPSCRPRQQQQQQLQQQQPAADVVIRQVQVVPQQQHGVKQLRKRKLNRSDQHFRIAGSFRDTDRLFFAGHFRSDRKQSRNRKHLLESGVVDTAAAPPSPQQQRRQHCNVATEQRYVTEICVGDSAERRNAAVSKSFRGRPNGDVIGFGRRQSQRHQPQRRSVTCITRLRLRDAAKRQWTKLEPGTNQEAASPVRTRSHVH